MEPQADQGYASLVNAMIQNSIAASHQPAGDVMASLAKALDVSVSTLYRVRQGKLVLPPTKTRALAHFGTTQLGTSLPSHWETDLLRAANIVEIPSSQVHEPLVSYISPPGYRQHEETQLVLPWHEGLSSKNWDHLYGREPQFTQILDRLKKPGSHCVIPITGVGGIGKTALALEVAWYFVEKYDDIPPQERFDHIIWVTAKDSFVSNGQVVPSYLPYFRTVDEMFEEIIGKLGMPSVLPHGDQWEHVLNVHLRRSGRVLLLLDNLETLTLKDMSRIEGFLASIPETTKAIVTTRYQTTLLSPLRLTPLQEHDMTVFVAQLYMNQEDKEEQQKSKEHEEEVRTRIKEWEELNKKLLFGNPLIAEWSIAHLVQNHQTAEEFLHYVMPQSEETHDYSILQQHFEDLFTFIFAQTITDLKRHQESVMLLQILARAKVEYVLTFDNLAEIIDTTSERVQDHLQVLYRYHLITRHGQAQSVSLASIVRLLLHAPQFSAEFNNTIEDRYRIWYGYFVYQHADQDYNARDWSLHYNQIRDHWPNIMQLLWTFVHDQQLIKVFIDWWFGADLDRFAEIYGYWHDRIIFCDELTRSEPPLVDDNIRAQAFVNLAMTQLFMADPQTLNHTENILQQAWDLCPEPSLMRARVALQFAHLEGRGRAFASAHPSQVQSHYQAERKWNAIAEKQLQKITLHDLEWQRVQLDLTYNMGIAAFRSEDIIGAKELFQTTMMLAEQYGRRRGHLSAINWLADIAIKEGHYSEAQTLLDGHFNEVKKLHEKRRIASYHRSYAELFNALGKRSEACDHATKALAIYDEQLMMQPETRKLQYLLAVLSA